MNRILFKPIPSDLQGRFGPYSKEHRFLAENNARFRAEGVSDQFFGDTEVRTVSDICSGTGTYLDGHYLSDVLLQPQAYAGVGTMLRWMEHLEEISPLWLDKIVSARRCMVFAGTRVTIKGSKSHLKTQDHCLVLEIDPDAGWMQVFTVSTLTTRFAMDFDLPLIAS